MVIYLIPHLWGCAKCFPLQDVNTLRNKPTVLGVLCALMLEQESFLYLAAIQALAALADVMPETIAVIMQQYSFDFECTLFVDHHQCKCFNCLVVKKNYLVRCNNLIIHFSLDIIIVDYFFLLYVA
jgi:hypothetical protein